MEDSSGCSPVQYTLILGWSLPVISAVLDIRFSFQMARIWILSTLVIFARVKCRHFVHGLLLELSLFDSIYISVNSTRGFLVLFYRTGQGIPSTLKAEFVAKILFRSSDSPSLTSIPSYFLLPLLVKQQYETMLRTFGELNEQRVHDVSVNTIMKFIIVEDRLCSNECRNNIVVVCQG